MAGSQRAAAVVVPAQEIFHRLRVKLHMVLIAAKAEDLRKLGPVYIIYLDLGTQPPQKSFIHQGARLKVGGEDNKLVKGNGELLAGAQAQEILAGFQGNDPSVQELLGRNLL